VLGTIAECIAFDRGERSRYTWLDLGSSFAPNEITAAVLLAQLERAEEITSHRRALWARYHSEFTALESTGIARRPFVPDDVEHNGHLYYLLLADEAARNRFISKMYAWGITTRSTSCRSTTRLEAVAMRVRRATYRLPTRRRGDWCGCHCGLVWKLSRTE